MKGLLIGVLIAIIFALGGFIIYDKTNNGNDTSSQSNSNTATSVQGKTLDLSGQGITEVGPSIYDQTDVEILILSNNLLKSLKSEMGRMTKLRVLKLDYNQLEGSLIAEIRKMPLVELDVSNNKMTGMPAEIGQLTKLETLNYAYNNIDTLPNELANIKQLKTLILTGNPLTAAAIAELRSKMPETEIVF